jgi:hypothetical protein
MKVNTKLICSGIIIMLCLGMKFVDGATTPPTIDPDSAILSALQTLCSPAAISSANSTTLGTMVTVLNNAKTLYSNPSNTVDLGIIAPLISQAQTQLSGTAGTTGTPQSTEMARVNGILNNFTVTPATYGAQLSVLQNLVKSVATNVAANPALSYTSVQSSFLTALTNLCSEMPAATQANIPSLQALQNFLYNLTLTSTPLLSSATVINPLMQQVGSVVNTATNTPVQPVTPTPAPTPAPALTIDQQITNAIAAAMANSTIAGKITALNAIATNSTYKTATVLPATQMAFATAIMAVGGTYIYGSNGANANALVAFYTKMKKIKKLTAAEKASIKKTIVPYITSIGGNISNFNNLLTNSLNTTLLTGPATVSGTQKYFVKNTLIALINLLQWLNQKA